MTAMTNRRNFLRAAGVLLALPSIGRAAEGLPPKRLLAIHVPLGMMPQYFFPKPGESSSPYLDLLAKHRDRFTTFAGLSHPDVDGNHHAGQCFLTGAAHPGQPTFRNSISLDQLVAQRIGLDTRFASLALAVRQGEHYADSIAVSPAGVIIPASVAGGVAGFSGAVHASPVPARRRPRAEMATCKQVAVRMVIGRFPVGSDQVAVSCPAECRGRRHWLCRLVYARPKCRLPSCKSRIGV